MPAGKGYTVTYDGVASTSLTGFICHGVSRGLVGERRTQYETIAGREGSYVFAEEPGFRTIEVEGSVLVDDMDPIDRRAAVRQVAAWYNKPTMRKLSSSDEPGVYDMAIPASAPDVDEWRERGTFALPFLCEPYSYQTTLQTMQETGMLATETMVIPVVGDVWTPLIVQITFVGSAAWSEIQVGDRVWRRTAASVATNKVTFNTRAGVITNVINGDPDLQGIFDPLTVSMAAVTGRPPRLEAGNNTLTVRSSSGGHTIDVWWRGRYS